MSWFDEFDWKNALKTIAPTVAGLIAAPVGFGPLANAGVRAILDAAFPEEDHSRLTPPEMEEKLSTALASGRLSPEQIAAMRKADQDFEKQMAELGLKELEVHAADRASARERDVELIRAGRANARANVMLIGACVTLVSIATILAAHHLLQIDPAGIVAGFLITIGGAMLNNISKAFDFEFGSSRGSQIKTDALAAAALGNGDNKRRAA